MAKLFTSEQIKRIDTYTIENEPITSVDLMERAANALHSWVTKKFTKDIQFLFFIGPGNNGGDGYALARLLFHSGYENIRLFVSGSSKKISTDSEINKTRIVEETSIPIHIILKENQFPFISNDDWVIDALFGSGLSRPLDGLSFSLVQYINKSEKAGIVSIDIPSGLFGEDNTANNPDGIIQADYTLSFQFPKLSFFFAENERYVGNWELLPINLHPEIISTEPSNYEYSNLQ
jgi:hydroxyethylthiazole kinase-like uncharacterized protein yjeF